MLHVFYGKMREYYDIESLWTLGPDKDPKCQETDKDPYALSAGKLLIMMLIIIKRRDIEVRRRWGGVLIIQIICFELRFFVLMERLIFKTKIEGYSVIL